MNKRIQILDVFFLQNNQTIVVGNIDYPQRILECRCNLYFNGVLTENILCIGENIVKKVDPNNKLRSFLIKKTTELTSENVHKEKWELEFILS